MKMGYDLVIEQQQKLIMTPELKLALRILQLPAVDLEELIQYELEANPVLELTDENRDEKPEEQQKRKAGQRKKKEKEKEIDWKEYLSIKGKVFLQKALIMMRPLNFLMRIILYSYTLKIIFFLTGVLSLNDKLRSIGEYIIESLDEMDTLQSARRTYLQFLTQLERSKKL